MRRSQLPDDLPLAADILVPEVLASIGEWGPTPLPEPPKVSEAVADGVILARGCVHGTRP